MLTRRRFLALPMVSILASGGMLRMLRLRAGYVLVNGWICLPSDLDRE